RHAHDQALAGPAARHPGPRPAFALRRDLLAPDPRPHGGPAAPSPRDQVRRVAGGGRPPPRPPAARARRRPPGRHHAPPRPRLAQFDRASDDGRGTVAVRRNLPPITLRHVRRLPASLQVAHAEWAEAKLAEPPLATARRRARQVAFTLLEQGDDADHVERVLF